MALLISGSKIRFLCLLTAAHLIGGQAQIIDEYQVKAAFLYNFTRFIDWPSTEFKNPNDPIIICVLGHNPFGSMLDSTVAGKQVAGRNLVVKRTAEVSDAAGCHLLFVAASEKKRLKAILDLVSSDGLLTIGEVANFAESGGIINFRLDEGKVGLEINLKAAQRAKLSISSKLLSLAKIVKDDRP